MGGNIWGSSETRLNLLEPLEAHGSSHPLPPSLPGAKHTNMISVHTRAIPWGRVLVTLGHLRIYLHRLWMALVQSWWPLSSMPWSISPSLFFSLINLLLGEEAGTGINVDLSFLTQAQKVESVAPMDTTNTTWTQSTRHLSKYQTQTRLENNLNTLPCAWHMTDSL